MCHLTCHSEIVHLQMSSLKKDLVMAIYKTNWDNQTVSCISSYKTVEVNEIWIIKNTIGNNGFWPASFY